MSKKYQYVESGIGWVGKCPKQWTLRRIKDIAFLQSGEAITSLSINDTDEFPVFGGNGLRGFTSTYNHDGSYVLIGRQGALCGNINYAHGKFFASEHAVVVYPYYEMNIIWLGELLREMNLNQYSNAAAQPGLAVEKIKSLKIPIPSKNEQIAIANYLDRACADIYKVVDLKRVQIENSNEQLKARITELLTTGKGEHSFSQETGVPWIPRIPKEWKLVKLKRVLEEKLSYGANASAENENPDEPRYIRITDFDDDGKLRDETFKSLPWEIANDYLLSEGDVLFARSGATVGKTFIFKNYDGKACFAGYLIKAVTQRHKLLPEFLYYFTKTKAYVDWKNTIFTQATIQNIGADKYQYLDIPLPPIKEQKRLVEIVEGLIEKTQKLNSTIQKQIDRLFEYKKSLIHEVVTGKKQVYFEEPPVIHSAAADALTV